MPRTLMPLLVFLSVALAVLATSLPRLASAQDEPPLQKGELPVRSGLDLLRRDRFPDLAELEALLDGKRDRPLFVFRIKTPSSNVYAPTWSPLDSLRGLGFQRSDLEKEQGKLFLKDRMTAPIRPFIDDEYSYEETLLWAVGEEARRPLYGLISNVTGSPQVHIGALGGPEAIRISSGKKAKRHAVLALAPATEDAPFKLVFDAGRDLVSLRLKSVSADQAEDERIASRKVLGRGTQARWDPAGARLAYVRELYGEGEQRDQVLRQEIVLLTYRLTNPQIIHSGAPGEVLRSPTWSPDGRFLAFFLRRKGVDPIWDLYVRDVRSQLNETRVLAKNVVIQSLFEHIGPAWSSDGARLYFFSQDRRREEYYPLQWRSADGKRSGEYQYPSQINVANDLQVGRWRGGDAVAFTGIDRGPRELFVAVLPAPRRKP